MSKLKKITNENLIVVFLLIFAFLIRLLPLSAIYSNGKIIFVGADPFYHARQIVYTSQNFPGTINFDSYLNYPFGYEIGWPPLYDQVVAGLALIVGHGNPGINTIEMVSAVFPALLGALTIIPLYYAASLIFDKKTAILSAAILSLMPAHLMISGAGFTDHHVAEVFLSTAAYALFIASLKYGQETELKFSNIKTLDPKTVLKPVILSIVTGSVLALAMLTWIGAPIFLGLITLYIFVQFTVDIREGRQSKYALISVLATYITTLVIILPLIARNIRTGLELSGMFLSWFHVLFIASLIAASLIGGIIANEFSKKNIQWKYYPLTIIAVSVAGMLFLHFISPGFYQQVIGGVQYLQGDAGILETIAEARPILFDQTFTLKNVWNKFIIFSVTAVLGLFLIGAETGKRKYPPEMMFFITWTIVVLALTLSQRRFAYTLAINFALLSGYFINTVYNYWRKEKQPGNKSKYPSNKSKSKGKPSKTPLWETITDVVVIGTFVAVISISTLAPIVETLINPVTPSPDWQESLLWLGENSPETSFYLDPQESPEYGVLSWWDYGNWILYVAKRPVVANNFQTGVVDSSRFFATAYESEALSILEKRNVKYVITDTPMIIGKSESIFGIAGETYYKGGKIDEFLQSEEVRETTLVKLHMFDGSNLGNLRLIHESEGADLKVRPDKDSENYTEINNVKIFEYVPGATIQGMTIPNQKVYAKTNVTLSSGRTFEYKNEVVANNSGWYELNVPYSTNGTPYNSKVGLYSLATGDNATYIEKISIDEKDIIEGNKLLINIIPEASL